MSEVKYVPEDLPQTLYRPPSLEKEKIEVKVADVTLEELRDILSKVIEEKFKEFLLDPDYGLELREEIEERLAASLSSKERVSFEEVKKRLELSET